MRIRHELIPENYTVRNFRKLSGFDHWHQKVEMIYIRDGICEIKIGNKTASCKRGDMAIIHSGEIHSIKDVENSAMYICTFAPDILNYFCSQMEFVRNFISAEMMEEAGLSAEITRIFEEILKMDSSDIIWNDVLIQTDIIRMYSLLLGHFRREETEKPQNLAKLQHFQEALLYIEEHYAENITLSDVARVINYNTSYASSLFVSYTGKNFKTYLDSFRINKAVRLLQRTDCKIADISSQCGFVSIRTFNDVFRKVTGTTPRQLRNTSGL